MRIIFNDIHPKYGFTSASVELEAVRFFSVKVEGETWMVLVNLTKPAESVRGHRQKFQTIIFRKDAKAVRTLEEDLYCNECDAKYFIMTVIESGLLIFELDLFARRKKLDYFVLALTSEDLEKMDVVIAEAVKQWTERQAAKESVE